MKDGDGASVLGRELPSRDALPGQTEGGTPDYAVVWVSNRLEEGIYGYRDVLVLLRIRGHICELQLHLKVGQQVNQVVSLL